MVSSLDMEDAANDVGTEARLELKTASLADVQLKTKELLASKRELYRATKALMKLRRQDISAHKKRGRSGRRRANGAIQRNVLVVCATYCRLQKVRDQAAVQFAAALRETKADEAEMKEVQKLMDGRWRVEVDGKAV